MKRIFLTPTRLLAATLLLAICGWNAPLRAQSEADRGSLEAALEQLSRDINNYLKDIGEKSLRMGDFDAPPQVASDRGGNAIEDSLADRLKELQVEIETSRRAPLELRGDLFFEDGRLLIACEIRGSRRGGKRFEQIAQISDAGAIAQLLGLTGKLATDDVVQRSEDIKEAFENPKVEVKTEVDNASGQVKTSRISASPSSPFGLEVCVKNAAGEYEPIAAEDDEGIAFIDLEIGTIYGIRVFNNSSRQVAVTLTIDGLNLFRFTEQEAFRKFGKVIVPANKPDGALIKGWHKNNDECFEFKVGEYAESEAVKLRGGDPNVVQEDDDVGVITASFAFAVAPGEELPEDELIGDRNVGTVKGDVIPAKYRNTQIGKVGSVREVISVRYSPRLPEG